MKNLIKSILITILLGFGQSSVAQTFSLTCNNEIVPVFEQNDVNPASKLNSYKYSQLIFDGKPLEISISVKGFTVVANDWEISPKSYKVTGKFDNNILHFTIDRTGYFVIRFAKNQDFEKRIVLFVDAPNRMPAGKIIDITKEYGVDNSGKTNETKKIQKALNDISGKDAVLYFPAGIYSTSTVQIKSNSNIHFAQNARLLANTSSIYPYLDNNGEGTNRFIYIHDAKNIQVTGLGGFDGNGTYFRGVFKSDLSGENSMRLLYMINSQNITFEGILLKDPSRWNTQIVGCRDITFRHCKMMNNPNTNSALSNFDGWDPDASRKILIESCFGWAGDDNVAIKCVGKSNPKILDDVEDITIRNCVFLTKKSSLKIGTETRCAKIKHIVFENNDIIESDRAMAIDVQDKAFVNDVLFKNNRIEYYYPDA
jgi:polygalacturonase